MIHRVCMKREWGYPSGGGVDGGGGRQGVVGEGCSVWLRRYDGLVAWMCAHDGAWPRRRGHLGRMSSMSAGDAEEHRHGVWVHHQRHRGRACLSGEVEEREGASRSELLERLEGWAWSGRLRRPYSASRKTTRRSSGTSTTAAAHGVSGGARGGGRLVGAVISRYFGASPDNTHAGYYKGTVDRYDCRSRCVD